MKKTALITGINGQDGAYLAQLLLEKGYEVYGADRRRVDAFSWRLHELGIKNKVKHIYMDLMEYNNIHNVIKKVQPTEIYNLAAQSFVAISFEQPILTTEVDAIGTLRILEAIRAINSNIKFYQASTSEMFGQVVETPQTEQTPFHPRSPYGVAKLYAHWITKNYREAYNIFACSGILFNHESPFRGIEFVTKKITNQIARIKLGLEDKITLGNIDAQRDWGYAKDYVRGMWLMLQYDTPDDYVLATGRTYAIRHFVELAFAYIGIQLRWEGKGVEEKGYDAETGKLRVDISADFFRPSEVEVLTGNATKAAKKLNWKPSVELKDLIALMIDYDLEINQSGKILM